MCGRQALPPPLSCSNRLGNVFLKELGVIQFPEVWAITIFCVVSIPFGKSKSQANSAVICEEPVALPKAIGWWEVGGWVWSFDSPCWREG